MSSSQNYYQNMQLLVLIQVFFLLFQSVQVHFLVCLGYEDAKHCSTEKTPKTKSEGHLEIEQVSWLQCHPGEVPQLITLSQLSLGNAQEGEWAEAAQRTCKHQGQKSSLAAHAWYLFAKPQLQM